MNVFALGASRNIGYFASLSKHTLCLTKIILIPISSIGMLAKGDTVTLILRNPSTIENDESFKSYIANGKAKFIKGDATSFEDISAAWKLATSNGPVDLVMFTVGKFAFTIARQTFSSCMLQVV
jgi:hypothetical protein